ncbi:glycerate kinase-like [Diadema setosum]|uniref:glycerate kinase-like n=1 Tax=Diadema setosum TaxID=31175 RepID=UPI003B3BC82F
MVRAVEDVLGENVAGGIASIPCGIKNMLKDRKNLLPSFESKVKLMEGALNNIPDAQSLAAATEIALLAESLTEKDIVLVLISGGGSALLPAPAPPVSLEDKLHTISLLASRGATIRQLNTVRKNLSTLKGGRLAKLAHPAQVISLILSDIIGDPIDLIASGPTTPDRSSPGDCLKILQDFGLGVEQLPPSIFQCLSIQDSTTALMSPAPLTHLSHVNNFIIGSNAIAVASAINCAKDLGYSALNFSCAVDGEAKDVAKMYVALATAICEVYHSCKLQLTDKEESFCHAWQSLQVAFKPFRNKVQDVEDTVKAAVRDNKPVCIIGAGETVVTITGSGKGGRNQELALAAHIGMETSLPLQKFHHLGYRVGLLSAGTDGQDGPTNAAGALAILNSSTSMRQFGLDSESFLRNNDSYTFYKTWNDGKDILITGLTGTNVMDLHILLVHPPGS